MIEVVVVVIAIAIIIIIKMFILHKFIESLAELIWLVALAGWEKEKSCCSFSVWCASEFKL